MALWAARWVAAQSWAPEAAPKQQLRQLEATRLLDTPLPIWCTRLSLAPCTSHERELNVQSHLRPHAAPHARVDADAGSPGAPQHSSCPMDTSLPPQRRAQRSNSTAPCHPAALRSKVVPCDWRLETPAQHTGTVAMASNDTTPSAPTRLPDYVRRRDDAAATTPVPEAPRGFPNETARALRLPRSLANHNHIAYRLLLPKDVCDL